MQRIPAARFRGQQRVERVAARALENFEGELGLGAARHLLHKHRRRTESHRHRDAGVVGDLIEVEQRNRAELFHRPTRHYHAEIRVSPAARRHDRRAARDILDRLNP